MDPEEITRRANKEKYKNRMDKKKPEKKPFNPLDWFEFPRFRKWYGNTFHFGKFWENYLMTLLMLFIVSGWIWIKDMDGATWEKYAFLSIAGLFSVSLVVGFVYAFNNKRKRKYDA